MRDEAYYLEHPLGKLDIRLCLFRHKVMHAWPETLCRKVAFMLPRQLVLWALVRVASGTLGSVEPPDRLTYPVMHDRWQAGEGR